MTKTPLLPIAEIAASLGACADDIEPYGRDKAKFGWEFVQRTLAKPARGKLILVTAVNPTPPERARPLPRSAWATRSSGWGTIPPFAVEEGQVPRRALASGAPSGR